MVQAGSFMAGLELLRDDVGQIEQTMVDIVFASPATNSAEVLCWGLTITIALLPKQDE
jgi:hypothetical protein